MTQRKQSNNKEKETDRWSIYYYGTVEDSEIKKMN